MNDCQVVWFDLTGVNMNGYIITYAAICTAFAVMIYLFYKAE